LMLLKDVGLAVFHNSIGYLRKSHPKLQVFIAKIITWTILNKKLT